MVFCRKLIRVKSGCQFRPRSGHVIHYVLAQVKFPHLGPICSSLGQIRPTVIFLRSVFIKFCVTKTIFCCSLKYLTMYYILCVSYSRNFLTVLSYGIESLNRRHSINRAYCARTSRSRTNVPFWHK